jgi:hypothetical protein
MQKCYNFQKRTFFMEIEKLKNGDVKLTISFDITTHGHYLGDARNYPIDKITELINSPQTQHHIAIGFCLGYFGHGARKKTKTPHIAQEVDDEGRETEVVTKTTALSIEGNIITHTQQVLNTPLGNRILKFLDSGVGGFSFAWSHSQGIYAGADYVYMPNFVENTIIEGAICNGECSPSNIISQMNLDEVTDEIEDFIIDSVPILKVMSQNENLLADALSEFDKVEKLYLDRLEEVTLDKHAQVNKLKQQMKDLEEAYKRGGVFIDNGTVKLAPSVLKGLIKSSLPNKFKKSPLL